MRTRRMIVPIGLLGALAATVGCAGKIQYPSLYVLNPPAPVAVHSTPAPKSGSLAVRQFDAPAFLREGPIVYRETPDQIGFYQYHRWALDPRRAVTSAVIRDLQASQFFHSVDAFDGHETADYLMTGFLDHLEEVDRGANVSVQIGVTARLIDAHTGAVLWRGSASKTQTLDQRSVPGVVAAMSRGLGEAVEELVSSMGSQIAALPTGSHPSESPR